MAKMTITEALAEVKTINKRLDKKRTGIIQYLVRDSRLKDPLEKDGGSLEFIRKERQAIADLERRLVTIRTQIMASNLNTKITVHGREDTVANWMAWRREVADGQRTFSAQMNNRVLTERARLADAGRNVRGVGVAVVGDGVQPVEVVVNANEKDLLAEQETQEQILGDLDGALSLLNATTTIEV